MNRLSTVVYMHPHGLLSEVKASLLLLQRGLFERHKILFALMLTNKILVSAGKVKGSDVDLLLKGGGALDITSVSAPAALDSF